MDAYDHRLLGRRLGLFHFQEEAPGMAFWHPRGHLLHRLLEEHCHRHTEDNPRWTIDADTFRTVYSAHLRDLEAFDRGYGHG